MPERTLGPESRIKRMENGGASEDGLKVMFDIVTADNESHPYWMADDDLEKFVNYVVGLSQHAAGVSGKMKAPKGPESKRVNPIEATSLSLGPGRSEQEGLLAVHLGTFALTFAVQPSHLIQLRDRLNKMLVSTEPKKLI